MKKVLLALAFAATSTCINAKQNDSFYVLKYCMMKAAAIIDDEETDPYIIGISVVEPCKNDLRKFAQDQARKLSNDNFESMFQKGYFGGLGAKVVNELRSIKKEDGRLGYQEGAK